MRAAGEDSQLNAQPPTLREYNAAIDLIERNLEVRPQKIAYIDDFGSYTYADMAERVNRRGNVFAALGLAQEMRILLCLTDTIDFPSAFLGAIKAGLVPVAVNTLLTSNDYDFMLRDSRAQALVVSESVLSTFQPILGEQSFLKHVVVSGNNSSGYPRLADMMATAGSNFA